MFFDSITELRGVKELRQDVDKYFELKGYTVHIDSYEGPDGEIYKVGQHNDDLALHHALIKESVGIIGTDTSQEVVAKLDAYLLSLDSIHESHEKVYKIYNKHLGTQLADIGYSCRYEALPKLFEGKYVIKEGSDDVVELYIKGKYIRTANVLQGKSLQLQKGDVKLSGIYYIHDKSSLDLIKELLLHYSENTRTTNIREIERYLTELNKLGNNNNSDYAKYLLGEGRNIKSTPYSKIGQLKIVEGDMLVGVAELGLSAVNDVFIISRLTNRTNKSKGNSLSLSQEKISLRHYIDNKLY